MTTTPINRWWHALVAWWRLSAIRRAMLRNPEKIDRYNDAVDLYNAENRRQNLLHMSDGEATAAFDRVARREMGISGEEFLRPLGLRRVGGGHRPGRRAGACECVEDAPCGGALDSPERVTSGGFRYR